MTELRDTIYDYKIVSPLVLFDPLSWHRMQISKAVLSHCGIISIDSQPPEVMTWNDSTHLDVRFRCPY